MKRGISLCVRQSSLCALYAPSVFSASVACWIKQKNREMTQNRIRSEKETAAEAMDGGAAQPVCLTSWKASLWKKV